MWLECSEPEIDAASARETYRKWVAFDATHADLIMHFGS